MGEWGNRPDLEELSPTPKDRVTMGKYLGLCLHRAIEDNGLGERFSNCVPEPLGSIVLF